MASKSATFAFADAVVVSSTGIAQGAYHGNGSNIIVTTPRGWGDVGTLALVDRDASVVVASCMLGFFSSTPA